MNLQKFVVKRYKFLGTPFILPSTYLLQNVDALDALF